LAKRAGSTEREEMIGCDRKKSTMILTNCAFCAAPLPQLAKQCSRCKARYCGPACQAQHWKEGGHDKLCKKIKRGGGAEQFHAANKYAEATATAINACADDTRRTRRATYALRVRNAGTRRTRASCECARAAGRRASCTCLAWRSRRRYCATLPRRTIWGYNRRGRGGAIVACASSSTTVWCRGRLVGRAGKNTWVGRRRTIFADNPLIFSRAACSKRVTRAAARRRMQFSKPI